MNEHEFWCYPLGAWLKDCCSGPRPLVPDTWRAPSKKDLALQYRELCDGHLLSLLFREIDPTTVEVVVLGDYLAKQRLFAKLLDNIRKFYKHRLNQLIVLSLPDILSIVRNPTPDDSGAELNKFLLLILGCAVQSDRKKEFVERITLLESDIQKGIVRQIQKVTENSSVVLNIGSLGLQSELSESKEVLAHLERVMRERDGYAHTILEMAHETESDEGSSTTATSSVNGDAPHRRNSVRYDRRSPSPPLFDRHATVELASAKAELRKLRNFTEEKDEEINDLKDELHAKETELLRLQEERLELVKEARAAKDLRDELDCKEIKLTKLEKLEQENTKLREKLEKHEYYQKRNEQLKSDNDKLEESNAYLEQEKEQMLLRVKNITETESRLEESQQTVRSLQADIAEKNGKIEQLLMDQSRLEAELLAYNARIAEMERQISADGTPRESLGSLADQMNESERSETVRLRLENRKLRSQLETNGNTSIPSSELDELKASLDQLERERSEQREEHEVLTKQLHHVEQTLSQLNSEYKECSGLLDRTKEERDEAVQSLHEARRKFAHFQTDFGKKFERETEAKVREVEHEVMELRHRLTSSEEERLESEKQIERLREEQRSLRVKVDELREEKCQLETQMSQYDRSRKSADNERNIMKERSEKLEDELESLRMRLLCGDDASRRLENSERILVEIQNKLGDSEAENRTLQQQLDLESKKTQRLREDLVNEKARGAELVGRLRSLCAAVSLNGGKIEITNMDDDQLISSIDDVIMGALTAAKREADASRLQQRTQIAELTDLRRDIEKLRRCESVSLSESDDKVRELSQENVSIKEQVYLLQEKVRELQIEVAAKNSEIALAKRQIEELHNNVSTSSVSNTELARLQVSLRNLQLQEELLKQDNSELRDQLDVSEKARYTLKKDTDSLAAMHQALLADHDRLQNLHDLLTQDYERTKDDCLDMKSRLRMQRPSQVPAGHARELDEMRSALNQERGAKDKQLRAYADLHNEHGAVRRELEAVRKENDCLTRNCDGLSAEIRRLKLADQGQRQTISDLTATVDELTRSLQQKDLEIAKLQNKIEMLNQLHRSYDEESKNLGKQIEMLLGQNKELLNRALNDKDHHHQEQKDFQERLSALRRHKEKLEEKIMDQYRTMESKKCQERPKQPLVKRAAKALISRRRPTIPTTNGGSTTEDSSVYSADEGSPPFMNGVKEDFDPFPPTCSSSEDPDRTSPRYETINNYRDMPTVISSFRPRDDIMGGSVRVTNGVNGVNGVNGTNGIRRPMVQTNTFVDQICLNGPERAVDVLSSLPPRAPVRNSSVSASMRARPPPPPYPKKNGKPPPPYPGRTSTPLDEPPSSPIPVQFIPQLASTPKSDKGSPQREERPIAAEGEHRAFIREKEERVEKAMSIYENVAPADSRNESTVWYEYGCV